MPGVATASGVFKPYVSAHGTCLGHNSCNMHVKPAVLVERCRDSHPLGRLQNIAKQLGASLHNGSEKNNVFFRCFLPDRRSSPCTRDLGSRSLCCHAGGPPFANSRKLSLFPLEKSPLKLRNPMMLSCSRALCVSGRALSGQWFRQVKVVWAWA